MVLYSKSSAGLLSLARGAALARAFHLALGLALDVALRALALALPLALRLALPLVFALASASFFARRKRQHGPPEEPKSTPGGSPNGLLEASGASWARGLPQVAARPLRSRPWTALGALLAALGAVLGRSWRLLGPSGGPREIPASSMGGHFG